MVHATNNPNQKFRIDLEIFRGPLDLLLYLVRKHEVEITEIPISRITEQYLNYLSILEKLDVDAVGEFLEMASTLIEIKSRMVLPRPEEHAEDTIEDPREELVQRLLDYKRYRDAAGILEERSRAWQQRLPRMADDLPPRRVDPAEQPIQELELWDLVSAFGRLMKEKTTTQAANIVYDETPIYVYMQRLHAAMSAQGRVMFTAMFEPGMHKSAMIGLFLAVLELVRHHHVRAEQSDLHDEIVLYPADGFNPELDLEKLKNAVSVAEEPPEPGE